MIEPNIKPTKDGPFKVTGVSRMITSKGEDREVTDPMLLCRCGHSGNKPYCDGSHVKAGFSGDKSENRVPDRLKEYMGEEITINDNRCVCSHAGHCTNNLPQVFRIGKRPWIDADAAKPDEIMTVIKTCPSGALSYTKDGKKDVDFFERDPLIKIWRDGPLATVGGIRIEGHEPQTKEHCTLCRCGASSNKPFCDGAHHRVRFRDDKN